MDSYSSFDDYMLSHGRVVDEFYIHEYGHTRQSSIWGPLYLPVPALLSFRSAIVNSYSEHNEYWVEVWANTYSKKYFSGRSPVFDFPISLIVKY